MKPMIIDTLNRKAPEGAVVLFDGSSLKGWLNREEQPARWEIEDNALKVVPKTGDIHTQATFEDHFLHLEFKLSDMPEATGQKKSNSGVFLQGRYEVQVLDSSGWAIPGLGDCGAVYDQFAPLQNACKPALEWQSYDIVFRAPRCEGAVLREHARMTVFHNGILVQNNVQMPGVTGAPSDTKVHLPGHLRLQDHGDIVWFRNIWAFRLPREGSRSYQPSHR